MQTQVRDLEKARIVDVEGDIDMTTSIELLEHLKRAVDGAASPTLAINLAAVSYMDSSGIASLLETFKRARNRKLQFALIGLNENLMNVFSLSRLDQVFRIFDNEEQLEAE